MPTYTATDYEAVSPGLYTARLEKIEESTSQHGIYYRWCFVIEDEGEQKERKVYANVSDKFGPQSKARRWCEQMVGEEAMDNLKEAGQRIRATKSLMRSVGMTDG